MRTANGNGTRNPLRACSTALSLLIALALSGCGSPRAGSTDEKVEPSQPAIVPADPIAVDLTVMSGSGFSCFIFKDSLWCEGNHPADLFLSTTGFLRYARNTNPQPEYASMNGLWVMDNTICVETYVNPIPSTYTTAIPGEMTFCFGPASLNGAYSSYPIRFSSPPFSGADQPAYFQTGVPPFMGAVMRIDQIQPAGLFIDTTTSVSQQTISCSDDGTKLTCPTFEVIYE